MTDPWATPESEPTPEPEAPAATTTATQQATAPAGDNHGVTVSFKGGPGYDAPMIALRANDAADMLRLIGGDPTGMTPDAAILALMERAANGARYFSSKITAVAVQGTPTGGGSGQSNNSRPGAPAGQPAPMTAPGGRQEFCSHGEMIYREATSKATGKPYKGFFCPERDRNQQCDAKFVR